MVPSRKPLQLCSTSSITARIFYPQFATHTVNDTKSKIAAHASAALVSSVPTKFGLDSIIKQPV